MLPRSKSTPLGSENIFGGVKPKKKAPPRPPLPSHSKLQSSQSLKTPGSELGFKTSTSKSDLIDFASPGDVNVLGTLQTNQPKEFMYRVGASIFYIRSPLKSSALGNTAQKTPFSPPRPTADALLMTSPIKTNSAAKASVAPPLQPTIIRSNNAGSGSNPAFHNINNNPAPPAPINYNNNNAWQPSQSQSQNKYTNVTGGWDEPPKKISALPPPIAPKPTIAAKPTIIRPSAAQAPSALASVLTNSFASAKPTVVAAQPMMSSASEPRNYYDEPPGDFEEVTEADTSPPMPNEPPPPPPPVDEDDWDDDWDEASNGTSVANSDEKYPDYQAGADQPYAIALYDYVPEQEGDLALNAGDVVYLIRTVDDCWLYGAVDGAEGMFPSNHVNVVVPLPSVNEDQSAYVPENNTDSYEATPTPVEPEPEPVETPTASDGKMYHAQVLYSFNAEAEGDLSIEAGDIVMLWGKINDDWLYGSSNRKQGQFPANFVSPIPDDLPVLNF